MPFCLGKVESRFLVTLFVMPLPLLSISVLTLGLVCRVSLQSSSWLVVSSDRLASEQLHSFSKWTALPLAAKKRKICVDILPFPSLEILRVVSSWNRTVDLVPSLLPLVHWLA